MGSIHLAMQYHKPYDLIVKAMSHGLQFKAIDEEANLFPSDVSFLESLSRDFESAVINDLGFDPITDRIIIKELRKLYINATPTSRI
jgi:hypothetical protein